MERVTEKITEAAAWMATDLSAAEGWRIVLSHRDNDQLEKSVRRVEKLGLIQRQITNDTFPLSDDLAERIEQVQHDLFRGLGIVLLTGLEAHGRFTAHEMETI